jgi:hypothetical protein
LRAAKRRARLRSAGGVVPDGLRAALEGRDTGDLLPTNDATFQLQISRLPWRFIVRTQAPRQAVAPAVDAYFRNLGVEDVAALNLMWCENVKRGVQDVWSCNY